MLMGLGWSASVAQAQTRITGIVVDAETGEPLPGANVYLDGTTIGAAAGPEGTFAIKGVRAGRYTVVASIVGYAPQQRSLQIERATNGEPETITLQFELQPETVALDGVTVEGSRDEWLRRLDRFRKAFFGRVPGADECSFVNPEVLSFEVEGTTLIARSEEPLVVRNEALGYKTTYDLTRFVTQSNNLRWRFGTYRFEELSPDSESQAKAWEKARRDTYTGSFKHFIDALQDNTLEQEGFVVHARIRSPAQVALAGNSRPSGSRFPSNRGRTRLYGNAEIFQRTQVSGIGILTLPEEGNRYNYLEIKYMPEAELPRYVRRYRNGPGSSFQSSWIDFEEGGRALFNTRTGDTLEHPDFGRFVVRGYLGWYETAATTLPANYQP
jgi:hypothetical protein